MKTKLEIIDETIAHIQKHGPAIDYLGLCSYFDENGRSCAVGRCLLNPKRVQNEYKGKTAEEIEGFEAKLKPEYRGHSLRFWNALQELHDSRNYWNGTEITKEGKAFLAILKAGNFETPVDSPQGKATDDHVETWEFCVQQGGSTYEFYVQTPLDAEEYIAECEEATYAAKSIGQYKVVTVGETQYMEIADVLSLVQSSLNTVKEFIYE